MRIEGDKIIIKKTHDATAALKDAAHAREVTDNGFASDYKHVGNVDMAMLANWLKEDGVAWTDTQAVKDVIKKKLMSSEFSALRVWEGKY